MAIKVKVFGSTPPCAKCKEVEKRATKVASKYPGQIEVTKFDAISDEGIANMLKRVIAHELGHAICLEHHGDGGNHDCFEQKGHTFRSNRNGLETSGNISCVMRYTNFAVTWCHGSPDHHWHLTDDPPVVGNTFCSNSNATGINKTSIGHFDNNATRGNCKGQIRVRDRD